MSEEVKKLRLDISKEDPIIFLGDEKIAFFLRNADGCDFLIGICFKLEGYEPIKITDLQEGVYKVKNLLKSIDVESSI